MRIIVVVLVLLSLLVTKAIGKEGISVGLTCSFWNDMNALAKKAKLPKVLFVRGIYEGLYIGSSPRKDKFYTGTGYNNLVNGLDKFCSDYRNSKIWIYTALQVVSMEFNGEGKVAIDNQTRRLRALANKD